MKKLFYFVLLLFMASCYQQEELSINTADNNLNSPQAQVDEPAPDSIKVNIFEALRMSMSIQSLDNVMSRANTLSIDSVLDDTGVPLMYIINYGENDGFVVLSAIKTATPVLAFNDHGHINLEKINPNTYFAFEIIKQNIEHTLSLPKDSVLDNQFLWSLVEKQGLKINSRAAPEDGEDFESWPQSLKDQFNNSKSIMNDSLLSWPYGTYHILENNGLDYFLSKNQTGWSSSEVYQSAKNYCYWQFQTNYKPISAVRYYVCEEEKTEISPFVLSSWGQYGGYNQSFPLVLNKFNIIDNAPAGCGPIAMGQIMRYYEWPEKYDWSKMPLSYSTAETSDFLLELAEMSNATFSAEGTGITTDNANSTFKKCGYLTSGIINMTSITDISKYVSESKPVYVRGTAYDSNGSEVGHAFVACGFKSYYRRYAVSLYTVTSPGRFVKVQTNYLNYISDPNVYINWGYNGDGNGYYNSGYLTVGAYTYHKDLKYIVPTPNK